MMTQHPVKRIRLSLGLTQEELARLAKLSPLWVGQVERCATRSFPQKLAKLLSELGYDAEQIQRETDNYLQERRLMELRKLKRAHSGDRACRGGDL